MTTQNRRLLITLDAKIKEINRKTISAVLPKLRLSDLTPMLEMVAQARASYLQAFYEIGRSSQSGGIPGPDDIERLADLRQVYQELVTASQALETAIERDYLEVE